VSEPVSTFELIRMVRARAEYLDGLLKRGEPSPHVRAQALWELRELVDRMDKSFELSLDDGKALYAKLRHHSFGQDTTAPRCIRIVKRLGEWLEAAKYRPM
jgi:hypothetical protein